MFGLLALVCWSRPVRSPGPAFPPSLRCPGLCLGPTLHFGGDLWQRGVKCVSLFFLSTSRRSRRLGRAKKEGGPGPAQTQEPLGFCCAFTGISNFFFQKRELASRVVGGAAQQRNTTEHDRSCCSLFVVKLLRRLIHKHRWPTTLQDLLQLDFRVYSRSRSPVGGPPCVQTIAPLGGDEFLPSLWSSGPKMVDSCDLVSQMGPGFWRSGGSNEVGAKLALTHFYARVKGHRAATEQHLLPSLRFSR